MANQVYTNNDQFTQADCKYPKSEKQFIKKYGDLGEALLKEYSLEHAIEAMEEYYEGEFNSQEDFTKNIMSEIASELPEQYKFARWVLANACDWEYVAREVSYDYTYIEVGNKIHVFRVF